MQKKCLKFKEYFKAPMSSLEKWSTLRKSSHNLNVGDRVYCEFEESKDYIYRRVAEINKVTFNDLTHRDAWSEGYKHIDLLKHELESIYPDLCDDTVLYQIIFSKKD